MPSAAGVRIRTDRRLPWVAGVSSSATPVRAKQQRTVEALLGERLGAEPLGVRG